MSGKPKYPVLTAEQLEKWAGEVLTKNDGSGSVWPELADRVNAEVARQYDDNALWWTQNRLTKLIAEKKKKSKAIYGGGTTAAKEN